MNKQKIQFLINLYRMRDDNNPDQFKVVADCLQGASQDVIKTLETEGYIRRCGKIYRNDKGQNVLDNSHVLTEKGYRFLEDEKLI